MIGELEATGEAKESSIRAAAGQTTHDQEATMNYVRVLEAGLKSMMDEWSAVQNKNAELEACHSPQSTPGATLTRVPCVRLAHRIDSKSSMKPKRMRKRG